MPLDTSIALQTQGPADPLERYGKVLALKNAIQQGQSGQLQLQQQQTDFDDQQKLKQAYSDAGGDLLKTQENAMKLGVSPKLIINLKSSVLQQAKDMADLDEKKYTALKSKNEIVGGKINAVLSAPPEQQPTAYQAARAELIQQGLIDPTHAPEQFPGAPALNEMFMQTRTGSQMLDIADKLREAKFKERETQLAEQRQANEAPGQKADADKKVLEAQLLKGATDGTAENAIIDRFAEKPEALKQALRAWKQNLPAGVQKATEEVNKIYDDTIGAPGKAAAVITAETPGKVAQQAALLPGEVKKAGAEAAATEPIRARASADAQAYLMKQVGGPLQNVMDPGERARVSNDYLKANDMYAEKASDAQRLKDFVAAARTGNQSAAGLMTISELRSVVNRVNTKELEQAGGASLVRSLTNKLDKAGSGIPSEDTLKELEQVADLNNKTAAGAFAQKVRGIKAMSPKANLSETPIGAVAPVTGGWKVVNVK